MQDHDVMQLRGDRGAVCGSTKSKLHGRSCLLSGSCDLRFSNVLGFVHLGLLHSILKCMRQYVLGYVSACFECIGRKASPFLRCSDMGFTENASRLSQ